MIYHLPTTLQVHHLRPMLATSCQKRSMMVTMYRMVMRRQSRTKLRTMTKRKTFRTAVSFSTHRLHVLLVPARPCQLREQQASARTQSRTFLAFQAIARIHLKTSRATKSANSIRLPYEARTYCHSFSADGAPKRSSAVSHLTCSESCLPDQSNRRSCTCISACRRWSYG